MGLYINGIQYDILRPDGRFNIDISPYNIITNGAKSVSSDDCLLRDADGVYLTMTKQTQSSSLDDDENKYE